MYRLCWLPLALLACLPLFAADKAKGTLGTIERLQPAFDSR